MFAVFTFNTNFNFRQVKKQKNPLMQICKKSKTTQIDADNSLEKQTAGVGDSVVIESIVYNLSIIRHSFTSFWLL